MLKAFMDESGHSYDPVCSFVGMGGIVADETSWVAFDNAWKTALDEFIGGNPFHMKDFVVFPPAGLYKEWDEQKRRKFLSRLVRAILDSGCRFVGSIVSVSDFNQLSTSCKASLIDPFYLVFQTVTRGMALLAEEGAIGLPEPVALIYSQQKTFGVTELGRSAQLWLALQENADYGKWIGSYTPGNPKLIYGLQAADLFAYELTQEFEHFFHNPENPRAMRWAMKQFVKKEGLGFMVKFFCRETMLTNLLENGFLTNQQLHEFNGIVNSLLYSRAQE